MAAFPTQFFVNNFFNYNNSKKKRPPAGADNQDQSIYAKKNTKFLKMRSVDFFKWLAKNGKVRAVSILWGTCASYFFQ